jgi:arginase
MASVALISWPYDAGLADVGMGSGASRLLADEDLHLLLSAGADRVTVETVPPVDPAQPEITRIFELDRRLARHVARARARGAFPLVLAGNCISALGTTAGGQDGEPLGVVWLDAHADLDTPEDNLSGFTDVMGLSILTGSAWRALRALGRTGEPLRRRRWPGPRHRARRHRRDVRSLHGRGRRADRV